MIKEKAVKYFKSGYSCSESVVQAAIDEGLCNECLLPSATSFSGGMSSGCLCGAVAGSQMVLGAIYGREKAREVAKQFIEKFKKSHKATCCRILSAGFEFGSKERKENCTNLVYDCCLILEDMIKKEVKNA